MAVCGKMDFYGIFLTFRRFIIIIGKVWVHKSWAIKVFDNESSQVCQHFGPDMDRRAIRLSLAQKMVQFSSCCSIAVLIVAWEPGRLLQRVPPTIGHILL